ncbi:MAG: glycosyltransferase family 4 protein [Bryobacteraceae bacterium]
MRILQLTAGAANMYCGSCLRDNALAMELIRMGHDVTLLPLYTPTRTDEENVSMGRVFFGGISVYLQQHSALFRHTPWIVDRLWDSKYALKKAALSTIPVNPKFLGEMTVSMLEGEEGNLRKELHKLIEWLSHEERPDVIHLPYSLVISLAKPLREALDRPICCTLQGEDIFIDGLPEPYRSQAIARIRENVRYVDRFLAVSDYYAGHMARYLEIPDEKMDVVPLGIHFDGYREFAKPLHNTDPVRVGFLTRVAPEKGLHLLCDAYKRMRERGDVPPTRLDVAGYLAPEHRHYLEGIDHQMSDWGLADQFAYHGVVDRAEKIAFLEGLDIMCIPAIYDDPKGLSLLESMAAGTPVIAPRRGTYTEIVERTQGGILLEEGSVETLTDALTALVTGHDHRHRVGRAAFDGVRGAYGARRMAEKAASVYAQLCDPAAQSVQVGPRA